MVLFIVLIGIWSATLVQSATSSGPEAVQNGLMLLALPGLVISFVSMFGRDGSAAARSWFNELKELPWSRRAWRWCYTRSR
jgi:hypothetical protein